GAPEKVVVGFLQVALRNAEFQLHFLLLRAANLREGLACLGMPGFSFISCSRKPRRGRTRARRRPSTRRLPTGGKSSSRSLHGTRRGPRLPLSRARRPSR